MFSALAVIPIFIFHLIFSNLAIAPPIVQKPVEHEVKAIYWTAYTASDKARRTRLTDFIGQTELNAVVIDIKDSTGKLFVPHDIDLAHQIGALSTQVVIKDIQQLLTELKNKGIYTIARIAVFQDPHLADSQSDFALKRKGGGIWRDWKGLAWVDSSSSTVWQYNLDVAKTAIQLGFDEVNFDYVRFPSDGYLETIEYPIYQDHKNKADVMAEFFKFIDQELKFSPAYTSVDLFGMTLWRSDGMGIGQRFQDAVDYVDYISPMVYPSHYPDGFEGYGNPAEYPYEIVYASLDKGRKFISGKRAKFRPWLQDFDLGAEYTAERIQQQKKAASDGGGYGWMFWNASNNYTTDGFDLD